MEGSRGDSALAVRRRSGEPDLVARAKVVSYLMLGFWALVVLFPLYWLVDHLVQAADRRSTPARSTSRSSTSSRPCTPGATSSSTCCERHAAALRQHGRRGARELGVRARHRQRWPPTRSSRFRYRPRSAPSACFVALRAARDRRGASARRALADRRRGRPSAFFLLLRAERSGRPLQARRSATTTSPSG